MTHNRPVRDCQGCPGVDDHPRVAYGGRFLPNPNGDGTFVQVANYYHYDCLPTEVKADIFRGGVETDRQKGLEQIILHAEGNSVEHLHGDALGEKVVEIMTPINAAEHAAHLAAAEAESNG